jgi:hypothetical protein
MNQSNPYEGLVRVHHQELSRAAAYWRVAQQVERRWRWRRGPAKRGSSWA